MSDVRVVPLESLSLRPSAVPCFNYTYQGKREKRTAIIAPIRFKTLSDGTIEIGWACSLGNTCEDVCRYAKAKEQQPTEVAEI